MSVLWGQIKGLEESAVSCLLKEGKLSRTAYPQGHKKQITPSSPGKEHWQTLQSEQSLYPELLPRAPVIHHNLGWLPSISGVMRSSDSVVQGTVPTQNLSTIHIITHKSEPEIAHY